MSCKEKKEKRKKKEMSEFYYAVHCGKNEGIYNNYEDMLEQIDEVKHAVFRKCNTIDIAEHFVKHGVLPLSSTGCSTKHIFIFVNEGKYSIYFDFSDAKEKNIIYGKERYVVETIPEEWGTKSRDLASLLALSKCLEICSTRFPHYWTILVHFEYHYAYDCLTKWIASWKKNGWSNIKYKVLAQIIDEQKKNVPNVHLHYVPNFNMVSGISGFQKAKKNLRL